MKRLVILAVAGLVLSACEDKPDDESTTALTPLEEIELPAMRWAEAQNSGTWNIAALKALDSHAQPLMEIVPSDITAWCPAYPEAEREDRAAFWVGFLSALAKHESTYKPQAVNPNGKWFGLLQISPATARGYGCRAQSGEDLKVGGENLSCALRIMAVTVPRDGVIEAKDSKWRGVAADWGPLRRESKRKDISAWLKAQPFCATDG